MDGASVVSVLDFPVPVPVGSNYGFEGTGVGSGDGRADLVWRRIEEAHRDAQVTLSDLDRIFDGFGNP